MDRTAVDDVAMPLAEFPLRDSTAERLGISADAIERWCRWFVLLAIAARTVRYLVRFPLWEDECFLCSSFIDRDFLGLTRQLDYPPQIAPILYLWSQLAVVRTLGFNEWTLRLTAFVAGIVSVWLFARLAKIFLSGLPRLFAVGIFCVSYVGIRYAAEAKPYGLDLMISLAMTSLAVDWLRSSGQLSRLAPLVLLTPIMLGFSFPAVFVAGGLSLAIAFCLLSPLAPRLSGGRGDGGEGGQRPSRNPEYLGFAVPPHPGPLPHQSRGERGQDSGPAGRSSTSSSSPASASSTS